MFARLLDLAREEHLVEDSVHFVKVEDQIEFADVAEEGVENLDKEVDGLEIGQFIVVGVDARAEEETCVATVDDLVVAELDEIGLVFLVTRRYKPVHLIATAHFKSMNRSSTGERRKGREGVGTYFALELDLLVVAVRDIPLGQPGLAPIFRRSGNFGLEPHGFTRA